jgi:hypothetical protein
VRDAVGHGLKISIELQIGGDKAPPQDVVDKINAALAGLSGKLKLE